MRYVARYLYNFNFYKRIFTCDKPTPHYRRKQYFPPLQNQSGQELTRPTLQ